MGKKKKSKKKDCECNGKCGENCKCQDSGKNGECETDLHSRKMYLGVTRYDGFGIGIDEVEEDKKLHLVTEKNGERTVYTSFDDDDKAVRFVSELAEFLEMELE